MRQPLILKTLLRLLDDHHAIDTIVLDVYQQTTITDYMIICSGRTNRQVKSIVDMTIEKMKKKALYRSAYQD